MTLAQFFEMDRADNRIIVPTEERFGAAHFRISMGGVGVERDDAVAWFALAARGRKQKRSR
jgi:hypothetical protein